MYDVFLKKSSEYKRDIDLMGHTLDQIAFYLHVQTGKTIDVCRKWAIEYLKKPESGFKDPAVKYIGKNANGDREVTLGGFIGYLKDCARRKLIMAPTMTSYLPPSIKQSLLSLSISDGIKGRSAAKKSMQVCTSRNDLEQAALYKVLQNCFKLDNNGLSGAHSSPGTVLFLKSAHSTLTSVCRALVSYANANNERFLGGRRFYWSQQITEFNIIAVAKHAPDEVGVLLAKHGLVIPSVQDCLDVIVHSSEPYWEVKDGSMFRTLLSKLTDNQRAYFVYAGDMYHLAKLNPEFVKSFLLNLINDPDIQTNLDNNPLEGADSDMNALMGLYCADTLKGRLIEDVETFDTPDKARIKANAESFQNVLLEYEDFIRLFWANDILPNSVGYGLNIKRAVVLASDTDSTIFTTQHWVKFATGGLAFTKEACRLSHAVCYLTSKMVAHYLATVSANMGVPEDKIFRLAMKNEYWFLVFSLTALSKHYWASKDAQEGIMKLKMELELKGVNLRDSNVNKAINDDFKATLKETIRIIKSGEQLDHDWIFGRVYKHEHRILTEIDNGGIEWYKRKNIPVAYAQYIELWNEVFGHKYGYCEPPPQPGVALNLTLGNKTAVMQWANNIKDEVIKNKMLAYIKRKGITKLTALAVPREIVAETGIPIELLNAIDKRKVAFTTLRAFYLWLESLGFFMENENKTILVSDLVQAA